MHLLLTWRRTLSLSAAKEPRVRLGLQQVEAPWECRGGQCAIARVGRRSPPASLLANAVRGRIGTHCRYSEHTPHVLQSHWCRHRPAGGLPSPAPLQQRLASRARVAGHRHPGHPGHPGHGALAPWRRLDVRGGCARTWCAGCAGGVCVGVPDTVAEGAPGVCGAKR